MSARTRGTTQQLLFGAPEAVSFGGWSHSRRAVFESCPRRYYYEYYGSAARRATADPEKVRLRFLKTLQTRHERAGALLHLVLATYLRRAQQGDRWTSERLVSWALDVFKRDRQYSASDPDGVNRPEGKYAPVLLREYHYRQANAAEACAEIEARLGAAVRTFQTNTAFEEFRTRGGTLGALVEVPVRLTVFSVRVTGQADLAYQTSEHIVIVDWKLGASDGGGEDSLQLAVYGLWALHHFGVATDRLRVYKAHLGDGTVKEFSVTEVTLRAARARIAQDAERMAFMHPYGMAGVSEAFTPSPQRRVCELCAFQAICPAGKEFLHA